MIKTKLKSLQTREKEKNKRINIKVIVLLVLLLLTSASSPFWHIEFPKGKNDGVFGFSSMRSFLYSFGTHFVLFGASIFFFWILHLIPNIDDRIKKVKRIGNLGVGLYCAVSCYYLLFVFIDSSNSPYPDSYYKIAFALISIMVSFIIYRIFRFLSYLKMLEEERQSNSKNIIKLSRDFINEASKKLIN